MKCTSNIPHAGVLPSASLIAHSKSKSKIILFESIKLRLSDVTTKSSCGPRHPTWGKTSWPWEPSQFINTNGRSKKVQSTVSYKVCHLTCSPVKLKELLLIPLLPFIFIVRCRWVSRWPKRPPDFSLTSFVRNYLVFGGGKFAATRRPRQTTTICIELHFSGGLTALRRLPARHPPAAARVFAKAYSLCHLQWLS